MPSIKSVSLAILTLVAGYIAYICLVPPNKPSPYYKFSKTDRMKFWVNAFPVAMSLSLPLPLIYQALVTLLYPERDHSDILPRICAYPYRLNEERFTWSVSTAGYLLILFLGAGIRLSAYSGLGKDFTYRLTKPSELITHGIYAYMQHPSYTGFILVNVGIVGLVMRWDSAVGACWIPDWLLQRLEGWGFLEAAAYTVLLAVLVGLRVRDEETLLKKRFGKDWEEWHRKTARFVPGVW